MLSTTGSQVPRPPPHWMLVSRHRVYYARSYYYVLRAVYCMYYIKNNEPPGLLVLNGINKVVSIVIIIAILNTYIVIYRKRSSQI